MLGLDLKEWRAEFSEIRSLLVGEESSKVWLENNGKVLGNVKFKGVVAK